MGLVSEIKLGILHDVGTYTYELGTIDSSSFKVKLCSLISLKLYMESARDGVKENFLFNEMCSFSFLL